MARNSVPVTEARLEAAHYSSPEIEKENRDRAQHSYNAMLSAAPAHLE